MTRPEKTHFLSYNPPDSRKPLADQGFPLAVAVGFEPTVRGYRTQHFECCTFGRSDTPPRTTIQSGRGVVQILKP